MMHFSDEDIELCLVDRFGSIELNRTELFKKKYKNYQKDRKSSRQNRISSIELGSV
jgi:hypothetical protein